MPLEGNSEFLSNKQVQKNNNTQQFRNNKETKYGKFSRNNSNCVQFEGFSGPLQQKTKLNEDKCYENENNKQSVFPGRYMTSNYNICECGINKVVEFATENPYMVFRDGYGVSECNVDDSSKLRIGNTRKNPKCKNQIFHRPYLTVPYMGRGSGNSEIETKMLPGESTTQRKQCNTLAGVSIDNYFMPLVKNLQDNIQNPNNLIQENADKKWLRGGVPSRQLVKDIDYLERCGKQLNKRIKK